MARPKVYLSKVTGTLTGFMRDAYSWLPAVLRDDPYTSLKKFNAGQGGAVGASHGGPVPGVTNTQDAEGYWVDLRDLFIHGEQFLNFDLAAADASLVALPTSTLERRFAATADVDALFSGANKLIRQDGVVALQVLGAQVDQT